MGMPAQGVTRQRGCWDHGDLAQAATRAKQSTSAAARRVQSTKWRRQEAHGTRDQARTSGAALRQHASPPIPLETGPDKPSKLTKPARPAKPTKACRGRDLGRGTRDVGRGTRDAAQTGTAAGTAGARRREAAAARRLGRTGRARKARRKARPARRGSIRAGGPHTQAARLGRHVQARSAPPSGR